MFLEPPINHRIQKGSIEIICGSMFSGKTEELIRRIRRAKIAKLSVIVFKPIIDLRYSKTEIVSHTIEGEIHRYSLEDSSKRAKKLATSRLLFFGNYS